MTNDPQVIFFIGDLLDDWQDSLNIIETSIFRSITTEVVTWPHLRLGDTLIDAAKSCLRVTK